MCQNKFYLARVNNDDFIALLQKNKTEAFHLLLQKYASNIHGTCLYHLRNREDAEDLTQDIFIAIYTSLDKFQGHSKVTTWMYGIAMNKIKEFLRKKTRKKRSGGTTSLELEHAEMITDRLRNSDNPQKKLEDLERAEALMHAVNQLTENQRKVYLLHKYDGYSYQQVAEIMNLSVSSIESLLFRGKKRLRELLLEYYRETHE